MDNLNLVIAFTAGVVSFLAPCVLPLVPGYLAYLAGVSVSETETKRTAVFVHACIFVLGFSVLFALLGVLLNTILSAIFSQVQQWLSWVGGALIIFFGLYLTGLIRFSFLEQQHKLTVHWKVRSRYATSFLFGMAFAAGWTPCVGPALGAILGLAASHPGLAFWLLLAYALGLGLPFLVVSLFVAQATDFLKRWRQALVYVNVIFGIVLIGLGILVFTQSLPLIANFSFLNNLVLSSSSQ